MAVSSLEYSYLYPFASKLSSIDGGGRLELATSLVEDTYPYFFEGEFRQPRAVALFLDSLAKLVSTRFYIPPNMLRRILAERDPVVTSGGGYLRFEGFSACASAYARLDISEEGYRGDIVGRGTTNVDFNSSTRHALATVREEDSLSVCVGQDSLKFAHEEREVVERKVSLPARWIKGFVEVQAYQAKMEKRFQLGKVEAVRFLRSLPRSVANKAEFYVVPSSAGLRLSQRNSSEAVSIAGIKRLNVLTDLSPLIDELEVFASDNGQSSEWRIKCGGVSFSLAVTADASRGFSGEGQVLDSLAENGGGALARVHSALSWQSCIRADAFARELGLEEAAVSQSLNILGSSGLVGYDLSSGGYFHRILPFDMDKLDTVHPRLQGAKKLVEKGAVKVLDRVDGVVHAEVEGSGVVHKVKVGSENFCTCPWHSKYQGKRGQCKHILSVIMLEQDYLKTVSE